MQTIKWLTIIVFILFTAYTLYAAKVESFWKTVGIILARKWGRQVTADLFIGLFLFHFFVYLVEGSLLTTLLWLLPALILGNPVTLLYVIINFEQIISRFA